MSDKPRLILLEKQNTNPADARKMANRLANLLKSGSGPLVLSAMPDRPRAPSPRQRRKPSTLPPSKMGPAEWAKLVKTARDALNDGRDVIIVGEFENMHNGRNKLAELTAPMRSRFSGYRLLNRIQHDTQPGAPWPGLRFNPQDKGAEALRKLAVEIERKHPHGAIAGAAPRIIEIDCTDRKNVKPLADALRTSDDVTVFDTSSIRSQSGGVGRGRAAARSRQSGNDNSPAALNRASLDLLEEQLALASRLNRPIVLVGEALERKELQELLDHARFLTGASTTRWRMGENAKKDLREGEQVLNWPNGRRSVAAQAVAQQVLEDLSPVSLDDLLDLPIEPHKPDRRRPVLRQRRRKPALPRL
ncbi:MAG: hypothetical protein Alpg2KO_15430 [Alphaproteobacteria bacterium]